MLFLLPTLNHFQSKIIFPTAGCIFMEACKWRTLLVWWRYSFTTIMLCQDKEALRHTHTHAKPLSVSIYQIHTQGFECPGAWVEGTCPKCHAVTLNLKHCRSNFSTTQPHTFMDNYHYYTHSQKRSVTIYRLGYNIKRNLLQEITDIFL